MSTKPVKYMIYLIIFCWNFILDALWEKEEFFKDIYLNHLIHTLLSNYHDNKFECTFEQKNDFFELIGEFTTKLKIKFESSSKLCYKCLKCPNLNGVFKQMSQQLRSFFKNY